MRYIKLLLCIIIVIRAYPARSQEWMQTLEIPSFSSITLSPDNKLIASASDKMVWIWDVSTGECIRKLKSHTSRISSVAFSPNGELIASGGSGFDPSIRLWSAKTYECIRTLLPHTDKTGFIVLSFSHNGKLIVSGSCNGIKLWDVASGKCIKTLKGHITPEGLHRNICSVAFSPDDQLIASGGNDETIKLWRASSGKCIKTLKEPDDVESVVFSPKGRLIASASDDTIRIWDVRSGKCIKRLKGHTTREGYGSRIVFSVAFSPDGKFIASGGVDKTIKLWEVSSGSCIQTLGGHTESVRSVIFSQDGKLLVSGGDDADIRFWDVSTVSKISPDSISSLSAARIDLNVIRQALALYELHHDGFIGGSNLTEYKAFRSRLVGVYPELPDQSNFSEFSYTGTTTSYTITIRAKDKNRTIIKATPTRVWRE